MEEINDVLYFDSGALISIMYFGCFIGRLAGDASFKKKCQKVAHRISI